MDNSIDSLLESLMDTTYQSRQILQEGSSTIGRILDMTKRLSSAIDDRSMVITDRDKEIISRVKSVKIDSRYKIATYSNIHNQKKCGSHAEYNIGFVLTAINYHMLNPNTEFEPKEINEKAIKETFKRLTGSSYSERTMSIEEFRHEYRSATFGGFRRISIVPNTMKLIQLFQNTQHNISHINDSLILKHINSFKLYYSIVEDRYNRISRSGVKMTVSLNGYLACLDTAIRNTLIMYKAIRATMFELAAEYRYIFGEILKIERDLKSKSLHESTVEFINSFTDKIGILTESINSDDVINNDTSNNIEFELSNDISKSFKSLVSDFIDKLQIDSERRNITLENVKDIYGIISGISNDDLSRINDSYRIYTNLLNKIDMSNYISTVNEKIDFCKKQFYDLVNDSTKLKEVNTNDLLKTLIGESFWEESPNTQTYDENYLIDSISKKLLGDIVVVKINNLDYLFDNVINIPNYCKQLNNHLLDLGNLISEITNYTLKLNNKENVELVMNKLVTPYIRYGSLISCIFYQLLKIENESIKLVQNLIDDIN